MFRHLITVICLALMLIVTASWVHSVFQSTGITFELPGNAELVMRHAEGGFTIACQRMGLVLSMPHWFALAILAVWPLFHMRVKFEDPKKELEQQLKKAKGQRA